MTLLADTVAEQSDATLATPDEIFDLAAVRRLEFDLEYAGAVTPPEAWQLLQQGAATMIDVRTAPEFKFVGRVPGSINIEWRGFDLLPRAAFIQSLAEVARRDAPLLFICRSAVRSDDAGLAAAEAGFARVYNVLEGFEGQIDARQQRGHINGWRRTGLPWIQD
ncbi:MAG: rhodanese-like domain-containing protein [Gemmatimonadota bacterium]